MNRTRWFLCVPIVIHLILVVGTLFFLQRAAKVQPQPLEQSLAGHERIMASGNPKILQAHAEKLWKLLEADHAVALACLTALNASTAMIFSTSALALSFLVAAFYFAGGSRPIPPPTGP